MPGDVRWLSDGEQRTWRAYLDASRLLQDALERRLQDESGLSFSDYGILVRLSEAPGREMRMSDLSQRTLYSRSRLSHAVARLEELGWVGRAECDTDRRGTVAHLTDAGFEILAAAAAGHVTAVRELLFDPLTARQVRELGRIATAIRDNLLAHPPR